MYLRLQTWHVGYLCQISRGAHPTFSILLTQLLSSATPCNLLSSPTQQFAHIARLHKIQVLKKEDRPFFGPIYVYIVYWYVTTGFFFLKMKFSRYKGQTKYHEKFSLQLLKNQKKHLKDPERISWKPWKTGITHIRDVKLPDPKNPFSASELQFTSWHLMPRK